MTITITLTADSIHTLDLSPVTTILNPWVEAREIIRQDQQLIFEFDYPREPDDPREWSEIPEIRLWFIRLDSQYPWFPYVLDWKGELARYAAMLVPHQFSREGIQYNPEALEIFVMHKVFVLMGWMKQHGMDGRTKIKFMTQIFGYELDDAFFDVVA